MREDSIRPPADSQCGSPESPGQRLPTARPSFLKKRSEKLLSFMGLDALSAPPSAAGCGPLDGMEVIVQPMPVAEGWRLPLARRIRTATGKPVICAGVMRHPD
jgi:hypothetical protein